MKTKSIIYILSILLLANCNNKTEKQTNKNIILADKVLALYAVNLQDTLISTDYIENLNTDFIYENTFEQIFEKNFKVYNPDRSYFEKANEVMPQDKLLRYMSWDTIPGSHEELSEILFLEEWHLDPEIKRFTKHVKSWCPVRVYQSKGNRSKRKIFYVFPKDDTKGELVCESIFYQKELVDYCSYPFYTGIDKDKFIASVISKIKAQELKAFDPIYLIDKTKTELNFEDIKKSSLIPFSGSKLEESLTSIIFEEDWFFDAETLCLHKEVKSIGFVQWDGEQRKEKILFFIDFD